MACRRQAFTFALLLALGCAVAAALPFTRRSPVATSDSAWAAEPSGATIDAEAVPASFSKDPLYYYFDEKYGEAIRYAGAVLADPKAPADLRREVLLTVGTIRLAQGRKRLARDAFLRYLSGDPTRDLPRPERLPPAVTRLFYALRDSLCMLPQGDLVAADRLGTSLTTIAVGDIENNSLVKADYDTDHFCRGLVQVMIGDLEGATSLKVVDRQRLSVLMDEIHLNQDPGRMDEVSRVRMGRLSGAQSYLFGQFMQLDRKRVRIDLRWVSTETGEILLARGAEGSVASADDLFKLERKVLVELLAPQIQRMVDSTQAPSDLQKRIDGFIDGKRRSLAKTASYVQLVETTGQAVAGEQSGDLEGAAAAWERVATMSPQDPGPKLRARTLTAFRKAAKG